MFIRKAEEKDIPRILELLGQVLQIHADIRPDIFIPGTTKYTTDELTELLKNEEKPVYVAADEADVCVGYAFCQLKEQPFSNNMVPFKSLFIDDLCVDQETRGQHIGESLFEYVKKEAKQLGCYEVTLNVWAGNTSAEKFYEKMGMRTKERQMCGMCSTFETRLGTRSTFYERKGETWQQVKNQRFSAFAFGRGRTSRAVWILWRTTKP